jgi:hypothetical protein
MRSKKGCEKKMYLPRSKPQNVLLGAGEEGVALPYPDRSLNPRGCKDLDFGLKSRREKLLDDAEVALYCDREFDRHFVLSLS